MISKSIKSVLAMSCILLPSMSLAEYNENILVKISQVLTYDSGQFLLMTDRMPTGACREYFIVPATVPVDARQMLLSRALIAKSTGEPVNIGFDNKTCINGWYQAHRIG